MSDGLMDNRLLLLLQQLDKFLFCMDVAAVAPVDVVEVADDGGLFREGWKWKLGTTKFHIINVLSFSNTCNKQ